jgi:hypothetical protein
MITGQKVVCVNGEFSATVRAFGYRQLPVKGKTYTIREVFLGREKMMGGGDGGTVGLLLVELVNPPDPRHVSGQELGFSSERFAPLEEVPPAQAEEPDELVVGVGYGEGWHT